MGWIVGIAHERDSLRVVQRTGEGTTAVGLVDADLSLPLKARESRSGEFVDLRFDDIQPSTDTEAFDRLGIPEDVRDVQTIFRFLRGGKTFYIPAQALIAGLFCQNVLARRHLLTPVGFQLLGILVESADGSVGIEVSTRQQTRRTKFDVTPSFEAALLWTASYPSAKRMVGSVFENALQGRFDLTLPAGLASLSFRGVHLGNEVLVQSVVIEWVQPTELPLMGLEGRVPRVIVCRERKTGSKKGMQRRKPSTDDGLFLGQAGWRLSDAEWATISAIHTRTLSAGAEGGANVGRNPRSKTETVLRKFAEGLPWAKAGQMPSEGMAACAFWRSLRKDGRWDQIRQYLKQVRST